MKKATNFKTLSPDKLMDFDKDGMATVTEYGTRLAGKQKKISTRFHIIADVLRESNYWAKKEKQKQIPYLSCQNN